jgi:hypothetical protein
MTENDQTTSNSLGQAANPRQALPDDTSGVISFRPAPIYPNTAGNGGNCPLWDGHIIDATRPLV